MQITEKVSPMHPDKVADRIAGALVDYCYSKQENPKCAFEVLIGHGKCYITGETSVSIPNDIVCDKVSLISKENIETTYIEVPQDTHFDNNQKELRCGDNGVFAGFPMPKIHKEALNVCKKLYSVCPTDGKIVLGDNEKTICWSNITNDEVFKIIPDAKKVNPIGYWTGGGTMHGKDLSKADFSVNIYCFIKAQETEKPYKAICSIGDEYVNVNGEQVKFSEIVNVAKDYINKIGGFERLAEWGLR